MSTSALAAGATGSFRVLTKDVERQLFLVEAGTVKDNKVRRERWWWPFADVDDLRAHLPCPRGVAPDDDACASLDPPPAARSSDAPVATAGSGAATFAPSPDSGAGPALSAAQPSPALPN